MTTAHPPRRATAAAAVLALLVLAVLGGWATARPAAAETVQWSVGPRTGDAGARANYGFVLDPGAVVQDALVVTNQGQTPLTLGLYAADGFTTDTGQLDVLPTGAASTDLGSWIALPASSVQLAPGERVEVPFTLTVPADAAAGDHSGAIVTSLVSGSGTAGVSLDRRLGVRVHTLVSGDLTAGMQVGGLAVDYRPAAVPFAAGSAVVTFTLTNTGNTRVAADQVVRVSGPFGLGTRTLTATTPELLAGASVPVSLTVPDVPPVGRLTAEVALAPAAVGASDVTADPVLTSAAGPALSWTTLALLAAVVLVPLLVALRRRRRRLQQDLDAFLRTTPDPTDDAVEASR
ncbi:WxL protein peptidoglycan domain-containing protein [Modestobacter versicolor]|uniref:DUF916 domain-containing protein n=1 Tax=Modestobacter versicolor TaxID=429133 RepID=A0A323VAU7_9ACTN|nr:DUF916 domain-containing protein [Modestobacter versicolor]MBB3675127.1 hypothetical protein [Modestobacter versicolor]PZA21809.1 DUF916 domain-containing protein [Modestobacter versicolor]